MKRIFFLFLIMTSMTVVAQESIPQDTTLYLNGRKIIIKEHDGKIKVKMYEAKADNDTIENTQVFEGVYLDGRSIERTTTVSVPFVKKKKGYYRFDPHYPAIYFGFNKLASNTFQYSAKVPQLGSKSWEWGINLFNTGVAITRNNHWGLTTTLGLARIVYKLDDNYGFEKPKMWITKRAGCAIGLSVCLSVWNGKPNSAVAVLSLPLVRKWNGV